MKRGPRALLIATFGLGGCSSCSKDKHPSAVDAALSAPPLPPTPTIAVDAAPPPEHKPPLPPQDKVDGFEGNIEMKVEAPALKAPVVLKVFARGDRLSFPAPNRLQGSTATAIYDVGLRRMVLFNREDKIFAVFDNPTDAGAADLPLKRTGKKDKVDDVPCDVFEMTGANKEKTTACIAEGIAFLDCGKLSNAAPTPPAWMQALSGTKRFPARVTQTGEDGATVFHFEVTKFGRHPVAPFFFTVPAGFTERRVPLSGSPLKPGLPD